MNIAKELEEKLVSIGVEIKSAIDDKFYKLNNTNDLIQLYIKDSKYIEELAFRIKAFSNPIIFMPLPLYSKDFNAQELYRYKNVFVRYRELYQLMSDEIDKIYDVLIMKV